MTKADAYNLGNTYCEFSMPKSEITNTAFTSRNVRREKSTYLLILAFECTLDYWFPQILSWLLRAHFLDATRAATQFPVTRNSQITDNLLNRLSQETSWTYIQLFHGKYIRRSSFYSFLTVFWILSGRIRSSLFLSVTHGSLRTLCSRSAKRITLEFFHFLEALEDCKWR